MYCRSSGPARMSQYRMCPITGKVRRMCFFRWKMSWMATSTRSPATTPTHESQPMGRPPFRTADSSPPSRRPHPENAPRRPAPRPRPPRAPRRPFGGTPPPPPAASFLAAAALLPPPAAAMGAPLPVLVRAVVRAPRGAVGGLGLLYGLNPLGAAGGALATGFLLLPGLGLRGTLLVGAAANLAVAGAAWLMDRRREPIPVAPAEPAPGAASPGDP